MSLHAIANHMATKGRGPDSMLVHMAPQEVAGLQALAMRHGGSLTINPETGLPEAGWLSKLLPAVIGFALNTFAPGIGTAIGSALGTSAAVGTGVLVGGVEALRTGDIGRGLSAGLGAYGGAGLAGNLTGAGANALSGEATAGAAADAGSAAGNAAYSQAIQQGLSEEAAQAVQRQAIDEASNATARVAADSTPFENLKAGASAAANNPADFLKGNAKNLMLAAGPAILAGANVQAKAPQTVTKPGEIRPFAYDPYGGTYTAYPSYPAVPTKAAAGGLMGMNAGGYNPGELNFSGGGDPIVRMASGGIAGYAAGGVSDADVLGWFNANPGANDQLIAQTMQQANVTPEQVARATGTNYADVNSRYLAATAPTTQAQAPAQAQTQTTSSAPTYNSVEDLYTQILGRAPDAGGLAFWKQGFGDTIDPNEVASFKQAAQSELANRTAAEQQQLAPNLVKTSTPAYTQYSAGDIEDYIRSNNLTGAGVTAATQQFNADPAAVKSAQETAAMVNNIYRNVLGRDADPTGLAFWTNEVTSGKRTGQEMYQDFLKSAKANTELGKFDMTLDQAVTPYKGYMSADTGNIVDEWVRNTLGREVTDADRQQKWYKDAVNKGVMTTYDKAQDIYSNFQNYATKDAAATAAKQIADAKASLAARGLTEMDVLKQTGKTIAELVGSGMNLNADLMQASQLLAPGKKAGFDFSTITKPKITNTFGGGEVDRTVTNPYGNATNPGDLTFNKDGTVTVTPNIPYRPYGGFSGMGEVKNAYTTGGGSLGYVPAAPKTIEEFNARYNTLTGGSKQAYDYLTGKADYNPVPYTPTGQIMKPYWESVGKIPENLSAKKYIFKDGKYELNPAYVPPKYVTNAAQAATKTTGLTDPATKPTDNPGAGNEWVWNTTENKWVATPIATSAEGGLMAMARGGSTHMPFFSRATGKFNATSPKVYADGGIAQYNLGGYSDGGRLLRGPGDGVSDSIPATIGDKQPARLADGEFVVPARIVSELGNGSTEAGARKLYAMMDRVQAARKNSIGKGKVAKNSRADKYLPA